MNVTGQVAASDVQLAGVAATMAHKLPSDVGAFVRRNSNKSAWLALQNAHEALLEMRPGDRSPTDRHYAVTITDMEKVMAYFQVFVMAEYMAAEAVE